MAEKVNNINENCKDEKNLRLDMEIEKLRKEGYEEKDVEIYKAKLHTYNEMKDTADSIVSHLANLKKCTIKSLYDKYDINDE
ncbi:hypothetical protein A3Q56_00623 [Intoshia linei]|uniref:Uncharacterized protein n=1 Tax=Intoshia linei TaxID=1819745 RepID=A0A177BBE8_9BILA|nr:hypothetical protein A3Q56_00623 [Intoshia linei]